MSQKPSHAPRGADVREALLDAAVERYASGEAFSVRALAAQANVNVGQIHHLFGGKEGLRKAMLHRLAHEQDAQLAALPETATLDDLIGAAWRAAVDDRRFVRVLARQLIEHPGEPVVQSTFPVSRRMERALDEAGVADARLHLAHTLAAGLGFALFEPWLSQALDLDDDDLNQFKAQLRAFAGEDR
ncbi:MAG: TetR family transcriptional regulator [Myxococcota bacterium]